ncbi:PilZ domain-containing protein [Rhizobium sp. AC27/96]|uniref:PilZ domain-containing protein n=1 Tax=Rhizobium sp. AC27/96 TaxID=1841653 RepID=UPI001FCD9ABD|nr:PilZ domain-containing protein [Rhizobium sp. AC27/96]
MEMIKRQALRSRAFLGASIVLGHGTSTLDCLVKDISATGARLAVENAIAVPEVFVLRISDGRSFLCRVRWRRINAVGVQFMSNFAA